MWDLIIAYTVADSLGNKIERFTRRSTHDYDWNALDDGYWWFTCSDEKWSGVFLDVVWFTVTKVDVDGEETTAQDVVGGVGHDHSSSCLGF